MTSLRESAALWRKLALSRGELYAVLFFLQEQIKNENIAKGFQSEADEVIRSINKTLAKTASKPPSDLHIDSDAFSGPIRPNKSIQKNQTRKNAKVIDILSKVKK